MCDGGAGEKSSESIKNRIQLAILKNYKIEINQRWINDPSLFLYPKASVHTFPHSLYHIKRRCPMKAQELIVNCYYTNDGANIQDIVSSSFTAFLKKEIEKFAAGASGHV